MLASAAARRPPLFRHRTYHGLNNAGKRGSVTAGDELLGEVHLVKQGICGLVMAHKRRDVRVRAKRDAHAQLGTTLDNLAAPLVGARTLLRDETR